MILRRYIAGIIILTFFQLSCRKGDVSEYSFSTPEEVLESVEHVVPQKIAQFTEVDTLFFQHLAYRTISNSDGRFVLADRSGHYIVLLDSTGHYIRTMATGGRGPGELLDVVLSESSSGGVTAYDQTNKKVIEFGPDMQFQEEASIKKPAEGVLQNIFQLERGRYLAHLMDMGWYTDTSAPNVSLIGMYDVQQQTYGSLRRLKGKKYIVNEVNGRRAGGFVMPYSPQQIIREIPGRPSVWMMWTPSGTIAEIDSNFDTLNTIQINLPEEEFSAAELDSMRGSYSSGMWNALQKELGDTKVAIQDFFPDPDGEQFWLKLSYESPHQLWLIIDAEGRPQQMVQLPKEGMLTHISGHHVGVRLGPGTFALYEPVPGID